jgi:hypothetical protein
MYKSKAERLEERWMLEDDVIKQIMAFDHPCSEELARKQLQKFKNDFPGIVRVVDRLGSGFHEPVTVPHRFIPIEPPQVLRRAIDQEWPIRPRRTSGAETKMQRFLALEMSKAPNHPRLKSAMRDEAAAAGINCSGRAYERAWATAVKDSGAAAWRAPGRRKLTTGALRRKSPHRKSPH